MRTADLKAVIAIEAVSFIDPWSPQLLAEELSEELAWKAVAEDEDGQVLGYLFGRMYPDAWHLMDFAVAPGARRRGVGRRLLSAFVEAADRAGRDVLLEVRAGNLPALALYHELGFSHVGLRRRYYPDTGEDALVLVRETGGGGGGCGSDPTPGGLLLAIESSCDDSAVAVLDGCGRVHASVVHSQDAVHERYGGVVPEVASRAHVERMSAVVDEALRQAGCTMDELEAVAVTVGPGLIGALLVGVQTAKAIAWSRRLPLHPVNHLHGHLAAVWLADAGAPFPMVTLVASGGHTMLVRVEDRSTFRLLGQTLDDAAGEAFDKGARLLGLGYPGGKELDVLAETGDPRTFSFPIGLKRSARPNFSFSGVKTALYYLLREMTAEERTLRAADVAASYREAIVKALVDKSVRCAIGEGVRTLAVAGGVAANSLLRRRLREQGEAAGLHVVVPPFQYCTDNAAMIGSAALAGPALAYPDYLDLDAAASLPLGQWTPASRV